MRKTILTICMLLFLTGCSAKTEGVEYLDDQILRSACAWTDNSYDILFAAPEDAAMVYQSDNCTVYAADDGALEIYALKMLSSDRETAIRLLSGRGASSVDIVETRRFSLPQYSFCWYTQTAEGGRNYTASAVIDDIYTYAIVCSASEESGDDYQRAIQEAISSFGLYFDEGV